MAKSKRVLAAAMAFVLIMAGIPFTSETVSAETISAKTNLALNKTVYFSSEEGTSTSGASTHAVNVVDGNESTCWAANGKPDGTNWDAQYPEWLCIDLGKEYDLSEVKIKFESKAGARYYGYNIYTSDTAPVSGTSEIPENFTKIVDKEDNTVSTQNVYTEDTISGKARYVLVEVTSCNQLDTINKWQVASIFEIQVYGTGDNEEEEIKDYGIQTASGRDETYVEEIDGSWEFGGKNLTDANALSADRSGWSKVTIPHTWNNADADDGGGNYVRAKYWYHKDIDVTEEMLSKRVYIEFLGSNTKTTVYVNGQKAGDTHKGGYTTFRYDITDKVKVGNNELHISVDNTYDQEIAPISGDFNMYGGIYRRVYLVAVDDVHVNLNKNGSSGLFLETGNMRSVTRPEDLGELDVKANIVNDSNVAKEVTVVTTIKGNNAPAPIEKKITIPANGSVDIKEHCKVEDPTLWEGARYEKGYDDTNVGYQYTVSLEIKDGSKVIDKVEDKIGFRYFWIDSQDNGESGEGFYLNGEKFPLRGVNRHSYLKGVGSAMTEDQHEADMEIMTELGVNTIRLCHYPQTDFFYDLCDENGIIVWTEIPVINEVRAAQTFIDVTKQQLVELVSQQYNRPSVVFWGLQNEIGNGQSLTNATANQNLAAAKKIMHELDGLVKELDTTGRYSTQALNRDYGMDQNKPDSVNSNFEDNTGWKSDIVSWNIYPGWYSDANFYGTFDDVMKRKTVLDSRSMGISEYGWGANVNQHEAEPELGKNNLTAGGTWHPEEYQNIMNEEALEYINNHDELWGTYYWVMFDFAVDSRNEGSQPALNDKGLVTADRKTKKDSFYLYKANWNKEDSFTYISSRRWTKRETSKTDIKVYSNCDEVELFVKGKSQGKMESKGNGVFLLKNVDIGVGNVEIKSAGSYIGVEGSYEDSCTWTRTISTKADLESKEFAVDTIEKTIVVENNVTFSEFKEKVSGVNNAVYTVYDGEEEVTEDDTIIVPGMKIHVVAEDGVTESDYTVVSSNLCLNKPVTVSSSETGNEGENAVDGNSATKWTAANGSYPQRIVIDLEKVYTLGDLTLDWDIREGVRYYKYAVSASEDGKDYVEVINRRDNTESKRMVESMQLIPARYIKIEVTGCNQAGWATLFEIKADGYRLTSDAYTIDEEHRLIVVDEIPTAGLADSTFSGNITLEGNYDMKLNYSSGWIHGGNTVDILDRDKEVVTTYTICTEATKDEYIKEVEVSSIVLNTTVETMSVGGTKQLNATVLPVTATNKKVTYASSDQSVATVSADGLVTAKKAGTAIITAKSSNNITVTCSIKVNDYSKVLPDVYLPFDKDSEVKLHGEASIKQDPDNSKNKALLIDATGGGNNGNYAIANNDLSKYDFSEGVTISLNVRPNANSSDWNYLFAIGKTATHGTYNYCDGTIGFIARHGEPYEAHFPGGSWVEGNPVNSDYNFFGSANNAGKWHRLTYVYSKSEICIYVDGILTCKWGEGLIGDVLAGLNQGHLVLGAGASEGTYENFGGYIDDVYVYSAALDSTAVKAIGKKPIDPKPDPKPPVVKPVPAPKGKKLKDSTGAAYTVTSANRKNPTVAYTAPKKGAKGTVKVPGTVKIGGVTYKVTSIATNAFKGNKKITSVVIGKNVTKIGKQAFYGCTKLKKITIGKNVKTISDKAFYKCTSLINVKIPAKVSKIGKQAFYGCTKLKSVTIGKNIKTISDKAFYKCTSLTSVTIPAKVSKIGIQAFYGCKKLKKVTLGKNVKTISDKAFYKCTSLTSITIPARVSKIGKQAFYGCKMLKKITIKSTKLTSSKVGSRAFKGIFAKAAIKVPKKKFAAYKKLLKSKGVSSKAKIRK